MNLFHLLIHLDIPLAGEFSFRRRVLKDIRIPYDWGLEIGVLSEMFQKLCE